MELMNEPIIHLSNQAIHQINLNQYNNALRSYIYIFKHMLAGQTVRPNKLNFFLGNRQATMGAQRCG